MKEITKASELAQGAVYYDSESKRTKLKFLGFHDNGDLQFEYISGWNGYTRDDDGTIGFDIYSFPFYID